MGYETGRCPVESIPPYSFLAHPHFYKQLLSFGRNTRCYLKTGKHTRICIYSEARACVYHFRLSGLKSRHVPPHKDFKFKTTLRKRASEAQSACQAYLLLLFGIYHHCYAYLLLLLLLVYLLIQKTTVLAHQHK